MKSCSFRAKSVEEIRHDVAFEDAVAAIGDDILAHVEQTDV